MSIFTAVKAFSGEIFACCASLFKRGEADIEPRKVVNPALGQLNRENEYPPVPVRA